MPAFVLGQDAKLYRNTGTYASPTWNLVGNVKDLTFNLEKATADVTTRGNNGWRAEVATLKTASIEFGMVWAPGDEDFTAMKDSFLNNTTVDMLVLDGLVATVGSQGLRAEMMVEKFSRSENLEEALMVSVSMKPTYSSNAPTWFTVS
jgi:hypothetical protein